MKKIGKFIKVSIYLTFIFMVLVLLAAPVSAADTSCKTKYPIILAHGMGFITNDVYPNSFPGIVEALHACGATVYTPTVDSLGATRTKAEEFKAAFLSIKAADGSAKFNIIGHSHGGLYTRDAITNLGLSPYVVSHTSVDSPHRGSPIAQMGVDIQKISPALAKMIVGMMPFAGDQSQLNVNMLNLSTNYMIYTFNPNTPNKSGIYYQSWTGEFRYYNMFAMFGDFLIMLVQELNGTLSTPTTAQQYVAAFQKVLPDLATEMWLLGAGFNDGLVPVSSAQWGTFRGVEAGYWWTYGVDHLDMVNINAKGVNFDVVGGWVKLVKDLKAKGY